MPEGAPGQGAPDPGESAPGASTPLLEDEREYAPVTQSDVVYRGKVWDVRRERFEYNGEAIVREYVDHTGAVAILALDDADRVLLIKQYRHPVRAREWEIPAGLLDEAGEGPLAAAQRELAEEADVAARDWHVLAEFYTTPGGSTEAIRVYLARGVSALHESFDRTDEEADIEIRWVPLDDCVDAVLARRIQNPSLVVGILAAQVSRSRGWGSLAPADTPWLRHPSQGTAPEKTAPSTSAPATSAPSGTPAP